MIQHQVAWITGLSGAGKTTISQKVASILKSKGFRVLTLDGDEVRANRALPLGFSPADIRKNNRLIVELCEEYLNDYEVILVPVISPFAESRSHAMRVLGQAMSEIYISVSVEEASKRDPKGLYQDYKSGKLQSLVGVAKEVQYEPPSTPDLKLDTEVLSAESCSSILVNYLLGRLHKPF